MALDKKELGNRIKEARKIKSEKSHKKYTGQNLADELEISRSYLGDIESGRSYPSYRLLSKIANICGVPLSFFGDSDSMLHEIIVTNYPEMNSEDIKKFINYVKSSIDTPVGVLDWDLDILKDDFDNSMKYLEASESCDDQTHEDILEYLNEEDKNNDKAALSKNKKELEFKTPQEAIKFILEQPTIMGYGGFDVSKMSDDEIMNFANELLNHVKLLGYKYNK